jgi:hypothetical protein
MAERIGTQQGRRKPEKRAYTRDGLKAIWWDASTNIFALVSFSTVTGPESAPSSCRRCWYPALIPASMPTLFASHTSLPSHFKAQLTLFPALYCELHFLETPAFPKEQTKMEKNTHTRAHAHAHAHTKTKPKGVNSQGKKISKGNWKNKREGEVLTYRAMVMTAIAISSFLEKSQCSLHPRRAALTSPGDPKLRSLMGSWTRCLSVFRSVPRW